MDGVSDQALQKLEGYDWPGNVRELRNVLERAALLGTGPTISADDMILGRPSAFHDHGRRLLPLPTTGIKFHDLEKDLVAQALERTEGNQTKAAQLLGMTREKIHYRMAKYGLLEPESGS
ncbi:MAG TPA: helix-turn-helix domain-containing protein [Thermodesulfobacteriota bacterium]|nr:helix-turn-helix domain-containing protein [Thermodesulfobacteriota bacterium]